MEKISTVQDSPEWFRLKNYDFLLDITLQELLHQLNCRALIYHQPQEGDYRSLKRIWSGNPILVPSTRAEIKEDCKKLGIPFLDINIEKLKPRLASSNNVQPVSFSRLKRAYLTAQENGAFTDGELKSDYLGASYSCMEAELMRKKSSAEYAPNTVMVDINLDATIDEIIQDLKESVPEWRQQKNAPEIPLNSGRMGEKILAKLIVQRTIPMIDLILWQRDTGVEISYAVLSQILFGNDATKYPSGQDIKRIHIPAAEKALSEDYLRSAYLLVSREPVLASRMVSDHLKLTKFVYP